MAFTFTDQPKAAERKRKAAERRKAERERMRQQRRAYEEARRAREEYYWSRFAGGSNGGSSSPRIAMADQALALEIINAGYRILSLRNHPDHGGSHDKMVEINRVGDALRALAGGKK
jgi:hypothetical protein